jgi:16S rRNA (guanine527-N7)-methyltransferase
MSFADEPRPTRPPPRPLTATERAAERRQLEAGLGDLGAWASAGQLDQLQRLLDLTEEANAQFNLTAIRERPDMLVKHVLDSVTVLPFLPDRPGARVADIGTGAGFPGLVLAILRPDLQFLLVDSVGKKARHVGATAHALGLVNARAENARAESLRSMGTQQGGFAVVVARALSSLADFVKHAGHLAAEDGFLLAMKGKVPEAEITELARARGLPDGRWKVVAVHPLKVPGLVDERHLVELCRE